MTLTLFISKALLCAAAQCWPVLVGPSMSPPGTYSIVQRITADPGYGGDVLQFFETENMVYAIHRTWTLRPNEHREARLRDPNPRSRVITKGCINIDPLVYNELVASYRSGTLSTLKIEP